MKRYWNINPIQESEFKTDLDMYRAEELDRLIKEFVRSDNYIDDVIERVFDKDLAEDYGVSYEYQVDALKNLVKPMVWFYEKQILKNLSYMPIPAIEESLEELVAELSYLLEPLFDEDEGDINLFDEFKESIFTDIVDLDPLDGIVPDEDLTRYENRYFLLKTLLPMLSVEIYNDVSQKR